MTKKSTLIKKLASYSGLAAAAMISAKSSDAQILYTDLTPDDTTYSAGSYALDLNNDGATDFNFNLLHIVGTNPAHQVRVVGESSNAIIRDLINWPGSWQGYAYADTILYGNPIGAADVFFSQEIVASHYTNGNDFGNWMNTQDHYMGLTVVVNSKTYYGWVRMGVSDACAYMVVNDYAMDTVANESIKAGDKCGNYSSLVNTEITVPDPAGFCEGSSVMISTDTLSGQTYQWLLNGEVIDGAVLYSLDVDSVGDYGLIVTTSYGCTDTADAVHIEAFPQPDPPVITQDGSMISTDAAIAYQWYHNGNIIAGATNQSYEPSEGGDYTVIITDANGCTSESAPFTFIPVGISNATTTDISVFESNNLLSIQLHNENFIGGTLKMFNTVGDEVHSSLVSNQNLQLDLQNFSAGVYLLSIEKQSQRFTKKIVVQ